MIRPIAADNKQKKDHRMQKQSTENLVLPDAGAILTGSSHPIEKEIRRKELPGKDGAEKTLPER